MDMLRVTSAQRILPCVGAELARPVVTTQKDPASVFRLQPPQPHFAKQRVRVAGQMTLTRRTSSVRSGILQVRGGRTTVRPYGLRLTVQVQVRAQVLRGWPGAPCR